MDKELYEAIRPVRGREQKNQKENWFFRFSNIYPKSFSVGILAGYFAFLGGVLGWCWSLYN